MHIQRKLCYAAARCDDELSHGYIWDEVAVHYVHVDPISASGFGGVDLFTKFGEICGKDGRGEDVFVWHSENGVTVTFKVTVTLINVDCKE
jgi:hypothetical protein